MKTLKQITNPRNIFFAPFYNVQLVKRNIISMHNCFIGQGPGLSCFCLSIQLCEIEKVSYQIIRLGPYFTT